MDTHRIRTSVILLFLFALPAISQTDLPNLSTATLPGTSSGSSTGSGSTPSSTGSTSAATTSGSTTASSSASTTDASSLTVTSAPSLTSSGGASFFSITGSGPTVAGAGIPTMIVPDTSRAPFMQKSSLPEGTVFICVGAILGFLGFCVLAWRGLVAWSLHRSVKRAALKADVAESKAMLRPPGAGFYSSVPGGSSLSLEPLGYGNGRGGGGGGGSTNEKGGDRIGRPSQSHTPRSSLFFSPTAGAGLPGMPGANRNSQYLPAGYYAAGASQTAGGNSTTHLGGGGGGGGGGSYNTRGARNSVGHSPPESPSLPPSRGNMYSHSARNSRRLSGAYTSPSSSTLDLSALSRGREPTGRPSSSTLNLGKPPEGRAPSAYLEDLFENHGNGPRERF
ncbi:MAG: hypothetical protein Q9157_001748 [Trypethelium eluteriae]